ncbi:MAG: LON peptidase substrate-binding domain-containing protein [Frankiales bacterium]|nr:LON peptidase substrate-binding domain-containing protein [Frankiales bacterium]
MSDRLPLFPLGLVLLPGLLLPLHVFEERYRLLVRELLDLPEEQRRFGVVAIREGREVGADGVTALHEVGCAAQLRRVEPYENGAYDVVTTGAERFRLTGLDTSGAYLVGEVEWLPDEMGPAAEAPLLDRAVRAAFVDYVGALSRASGEPVEVPELPDSSLVLSYLVAATMLLDLDDRQALLAEPDGAARLRRELTMLRREGTLLRVLTAAPSPELARGPISLN